MRMVRSFWALYAKQYAENFKLIYIVVTLWGGYNYYACFAAKEAGSW